MVERSGAKKNTLDLYRIAVMIVVMIKCAKNYFTYSHARHRHKRKSLTFSEAINFHECSIWTWMIARSVAFIHKHICFCFFCSKKNGRNCLIVPIVWIYFTANEIIIYLGANFNSWHFFLSFRYFQLWLLCSFVFSVSLACDWYAGQTKRNAWWICVSFDWKNNESSWIKRFIGVVGLFLQFCTNVWISYCSFQRAFDDYVLTSK